MTKQGSGVGGGDFQQSSAGVHVWGCRKGGSASRDHFIYKYFFIVTIGTRIFYFFTLNITFSQRHRRDERERQREREMGGSSPDPARVGGEWFPGVTYALPDGLEDRVMSPALVVDLAKVRHNLAVVLSLVKGDADRWRPHLKTTKCSRVWTEALRAGVRHFKVATTREAEVLLQTVDRLLTKEEEEDGTARVVLDDIPDVDSRHPPTSFPAVVDVLIAYPLCGPAMRRAGQLARAHPRARLSVLVECEEAARELPPRVGCFVDVNPGMNRTG